MHKHLGYGLTDMQSTGANIILQTGFPEIFSVDDFRSSTKRKGMKLVDSNHIVKVREIEKDGEICIEGFCIRQTSVTAAPYRVQFETEAKKICFENHVVINESEIVSLCVRTQEQTVQFLTKKSFSTASCKYGLQKEKVALAPYEQLYKVKVQTMGFLVKLLLTWFGVSIDDVVTKEDSPIKLLEVQCPVSCKSKPIVTKNNDQANVS
ncbi:hypothetical protein PV325_002103 [Microctonus aethiopoides]|nr:hypothetical protein PV325_002103 [Microctonus aethiopoides]